MPCDYDQSVAGERMRKFAIILLILSATQASMATEKSCLVDLAPLAEVMRDPTEPADAPQVISMRLTYGGIEGKVSVRTTTQQETTVPEAVTLQSFAVREDLTAEDLNDGEQLIVRALVISQDPILGLLSNTGVQLSEVRSVKVFTFGNPAAPGATRVVESFDSKGVSLGSFSAGPAFRPCQS